MESSNPFSGAVSRTRKERKLIDAGIYRGTLTEVKSLQVTDKKTQEKKTKVLFSFYVAEVDTEVVQFFNPSLADTSFIVKFLKTLAGAAFTPEIQGSADKMWAFVKALEGADFNLVVTLTNGYNNVQSAMPIRGKPVEGQVAVAFNDEDIPF
jgi:hypothetical protein